LAKPFAEHAEITVPANTELFNVIGELTGVLPPAKKASF
jgi:hypothetical protein